MGMFLRDGMYWIDYYVAGRRYREKVGTETMAKKALAKITVAKVENRYFDIKRESKITFRQIAQQFFETYSQPCKKSARGDGYSIRRLNTHFGDTRLGNVTKLSIEEYKLKRKVQVSGPTVNRDLALIKTIFNKAIEWGKATHNPVKKVKFFPEHDPRMRFLEKGEVDALLRNCSQWLRPIVIVGLHTGMREGEIFDLRWDDINFHSRNVRVRPAKSGEGRNIPMNKSLFNELQAMKKNLDSPYIFSNTDNEKITRHGKFRKQWCNAVKQSGILDFHFHDLRHTFASHLVMRGVELKTVQELLGHKSTKMTERYSHLSPRHKSKAVMVLDSVFAERPKKVVTGWTP